MDVGPIKLDGRGTTLSVVVGTVFASADAESREDYAATLGRDPSVHEVVFLDRETGKAIGGYQPRQGLWWHSAGKVETTRATSTEVVD